MMSLTEYAKRRGVSAVAVSKAVARGRLSASVARDERGQPKIADPELADREWEERTRKRVDMPPRAVIATPRTVPPQRDESADDSDGWDDSEAIAANEAPDSGLPGNIPPYHRSQAVKAYHSARKEAAAADIAEIDLAERRGQLVDAAGARQDVENAYTLVRTRLLGVPSQVAQRLPHLAGEVVPVVDALLREALEELSV